MNTPEVNLIKQAWALSKINVEQWNKFLVALDDYTWSVTERALRAPISDIHVTVGMASEALEFYQKMKSLDEAYEKLKRA
jgi:hypothetical protein